MSKHPRLAFLKVVIIHKLHVLRIGLKLDVPLWRLIIHDWSKFTRTEFNAYAQTFYGDKSSVDFKRCWIHHQNCNPHHPEYWIDRSSNLHEAIEMPDWAIREMITDWISASLVYGGVMPVWGEWEWFKNSFDSKPLHHITREKILDILESGVVIRSKHV